MSIFDASEEPWELWYWPGFIGRAEFIRSFFEDAGVPYIERNDEEAVKWFRSLKGSNPEGSPDGKLYPMLAPPMIRRGGFQLCQTHAILEYLGKKYGYAEFDSIEQEASARQLNLCIADYFADGRACFHPIRPYEGYESQKEEAVPYIKAFAEQRMPRYVRHFESCLAANKTGSGYCFGTSVSYVDIALFHAYRATEAQWSSHFANIDDVPKLRAFGAMMAERPRTRAYLGSSRAKPFFGDSMM